MTQKKTVPVDPYVQHGRKAAHVDDYDRKRTKANIPVQTHMRNRRRTDDEIKKWGTRKNPKVQTKDGRKK